MKIEAMPDLENEKDLRELRDLLVACVDGGASIGFLAPLAPSETDDYWRGVGEELRSGGRLLLVARDPATGMIVGSAQAAWVAKPNGRHRAEVQKVMVLPSHRRRGIAAQLMNAIESAAQARKVTVLFLDTSDSHAGAREFYEALRYVYVGGIPNYALNPRGEPEPNAIYYKTLALDA